MEDNKAARTLFKVLHSTSSFSKIAEPQPISHVSTYWPWDMGTSHASLKCTMLPVLGGGQLFHQDQRAQFTLGLVLRTSSTSLLQQMLQMKVPETTTPATTMSRKENNAEPASGGSKF